MQQGQALKENLATTIIQKERAKINMSVLNKEKQKQMESFATCHIHQKDKVAGVYLVLNDLVICKEILNTLQQSTRTEANNKRGDFERVEQMARLTHQFENAIKNYVDLLGGRDD